MLKLVGGMDRDVHVWCVGLDLPPETIAALEGLLSDDERQRAAGLRLDRDRKRFIVAHGALRVLLGHSLALNPGQVRFVTNAFGKPTLTPELGSALSFNLSHSGALALVAVASGADVGVDVEHVTGGADYLDVAQHWLSAADVVALRGLSGPRREQAFFDMWTRKEAWAKARGEGLSMPEAMFAAGPDDGWSLFPLRPAPGYVGALAIKGREWQVRERRWESAVP